MFLVLTSTSTTATRLVQQVERLKKDLAKSEKEKAELMSKLALMEKNAKARDRRKTIISAYSAPGTVGAQHDGGDNIIKGTMINSCSSLLSSFLIF